jgi:hypothetical protein
MWTASQLLHPDLAGLGFEHVAEWTLWWMTDARPCCSPLSRLSSQVARLQLPPTRTAHRAFSSSCSSGSRCCSFSPATTPGRLDGQGSDDLRRFHRHRHVELQLLSFTFGVRRRSVTDRLLVNLNAHRPRILTPGWRAGRMATVLSGSPPTHRHHRAAPARTSRLRLQSAFTTGVPEVRISALGDPTGRAAMGRRFRRHAQNGHPAHRSRPGA